MPQQPANREIDDLESALKALRPTAQLQRDQLMFRAGRASARRRWIWPAWSATMTAVAAGLAAVIISRPAPVPAERVVFVAVQQQPAPAVVVDEQPSPVQRRDLTEAFIPVYDPQHATELWQMRQQALYWGIENLPLPARPAMPQRPAQTMNELIDELTNGKATPTGLPGK